MNQSVTSGRWVGYAWMGYFLFTIALVGAPLCFGLCIPLYFLSTLFTRARRPADRVLRWGIDLLMRLQPWLDWQDEIDLSLLPQQGGVLLVSNHRSHLDVFLLLARVRGLRILAKQSLFFIPFLGVMMRLSGQIPTRRGSLHSFWLAMHAVGEKLRHGERVLVFPEMTRAEPGAPGTRPFLSAPFKEARAAGVPVVPLVIRGTDAAWPRGTRALQAQARVRVCALRPLDPRQYASAEELCEAARQSIQEALA